jgi:hypothetical protein
MKPLRTPFCKNMATSVKNVAAAMNCGGYMVQVLLACADLLRQEWLRGAHGG